MLSGCNGESDPVNAMSETLTWIVIIPEYDEAVRQVSPGGFLVSFRLLGVTASADTIVNKVFTRGFNIGDSPADFRLQIGKKMQLAKEEHEARDAIFNSAAYNATPAILQANLN